MIVIRFVDIDGIVDHHCLEVVVIRFVDIGGVRIAHLFSFLCCVLLVGSV